MRVFMKQRTTKNERRMLRMQAELDVIEVNEARRRRPQETVAQTIPK